MKAHQEPATRTFRRIALWTPIICLLFTVLVFDRHALADGENCDLKAPLADAMVAKHEGAYFFVYPPVPLPHYNGCQIMWFEKQIMMIGHFKDGSLVETDQMNEDGSLQQKCFYSDYRLTSESDASCPAPEDFGHSGLQYTLRGNVVVRVPPDRDIRVMPKPCTGSEKACTK
jgi:hypothetical protein